MAMLIVYLTGLLRNQTLGIRKAGIIVQRKHGRECEDARKGDVGVVF